jgi:glycosyltransferase involved in cell wall biosynthesis
MTASPVVSVVTPVYNGQQYLEECIQSVLGQTYPDWEYLIFDNMSTDDSAAMAERYASQDPRIRLLRASEFLDIYGNHNRALRAIDPRSRYCKIVHADDWLYPECLERMVAVAEDHPSVGVVSAYRLAGRQVQLDGLLSSSQTVMPGREVVRRAMLSRAWSTWVTGSPTALLLRTDLVRSRWEFYDETFWHADSEAAFRALMCTDLGFVHQVLTFTRSHLGALTSFTDRVHTQKPEEGRLLVRYGPKVLSRSEYRRRLRRWLIAYGWYLTKQALRPSRYREPEFHDFHRREIDYIMAEAGHAGMTPTVLSIYRRLLHNPPCRHATNPQPALDGS